jgi:hypothetical protein
MIFLKKIVMVLMDGCIGINDLIIEIDGCGIIHVI